MLFMSCVCHAFASVHCCPVVTCWERAELLALVCDVKLCFVTLPHGILGLFWYLIVSIPDLCRLSSFYFLDITSGDDDNIHQRHIDQTSLHLIPDV